MTSTKPAGVYFVDTEGILIDHGDDRIVLIMKGKRVNSAVLGNDARNDQLPAQLAEARAQCIDQIDILDGKMRELEKTIGDLRHAYLLLTEKKWGAQ
jgi:hypothetical protein